MRAYLEEVVSRWFFYYYFRSQKYGLCFLNIDFGWLKVLNYLGLRAVAAYKLVSYKKCISRLFSLLFYWEEFYRIRRIHRVRSNQVYVRCTSALQI